MRVKELKRFNLELILEPEDYEQLDSDGSLSYCDNANTVFSIFAEKINKDSLLGLQDQPIKQNGYAIIYPITNKIDIYIPLDILEDGGVLGSFFSRRIGNIDVIPNLSNELLDNSLLVLNYSGYTDYFISKSKI